MVDVNQLKGAFGSVVDDATTTAAKNAAAQQLGKFGVPDQLNPFVPAPTVAPPPVGNTKSLAVEDQQKPRTLAARAAAFVKQYQRVLIIGGVVVLVVGLFLRKKRRK